MSKITYTCKCGRKCTLLSTPHKFEFKVSPPVTMKCGACGHIGDFSQLIK